jgi:uncharacterized membrane protein YidH (DUF202 family)
MSSQAVFDRVFGTRGHTEGAELQLPRKIPLRVEPKSYFGEPLQRALQPAAERFPRFQHRDPSPRGAPTRAPGAHRVPASRAAASQDFHSSQPWLGPTPPPRPRPSHNQPTSPAANERTFLSWASMATTMGGVSSALVGFSLSNPDPAVETHGKLINKRTIDIISCIYIPVSIIMILYALSTYLYRSRFMHKKQIGFFDDHFGPVAIACLVLLTMIAITIMGVIDVLW